uniref:Uncharacterized protein n=1 Tax=Meloidogyne incognita TaxID=6306 RepID=A0A914LC80_MELIC
MRQLTKLNSSTPLLLMVAMDLFNDVLNDVLNMKMAHWQNGMVRCNSSNWWLLWWLAALMVAEWAIALFMVALLLLDLLLVEGLDGGPVLGQMWMLVDFAAVWPDMDGADWSAVWPYGGYCQV